MKASVFAIARIAAAGVAAARLARARDRLPAVASSAGEIGLTISVVVPARDEATRIGPLLAALRDAPGVGEVIVVDDQSSDGTAEVARAGGARVVGGAPLPTGWAGKAWALQQGLLAATGEWVVTLDADTRPSPALPRSLVARAVRDGIGLVTVAGRFECPTPGTAWLHPAMLATLVYRFGAPDSTRPSRPPRVLANGQCMAFARRALVAAGGFAPVADRVVEDVALARHLAGRGWSVVMLDGQELLSTRMFESFGDTWRGWSRSLALPGVEPFARQLTDLGVVLIAQALPLARVLARRADVLDLALLAMRGGTLAGTASAYRPRGAAFWLSPLADLAAVGALAAGIVRRRQRWRGRSYG